MLLLAAGLLGSFVVVPLNATSALIAGLEGVAVEARWDGAAEWEPLVELAGVRHEVVERDSRWLGGELRCGEELRRWEAGPPFEEWTPIPVDGGLLLVQTTEVTNQQYLTFARATGRDPAPDLGFPGMRGYARNFPEHPAVHVSFFDARAYCRWRGHELDAADALRLPSGAEWERAALGVREVGRGGALFTGPRAGGVNGDDVSRWGVRDLGGNVAEWCVDRVDGMEHGATVVRRMIRGGSWDGAGAMGDNRSGSRSHFAIEQGRFSTVGFRPVWRIDLPGEGGS